MIQNLTDNESIFIYPISDSQEEDSDRVDVAERVESLKGIDFSLLFCHKEYISP